MFLLCSGGGAQLWILAAFVLVEEVATRLQSVIVRAEHTRLVEVVQSGDAPVQPHLTQRLVHDVLQTDNTPAVTRSVVARSHKRPKHFFQHFFQSHSCFDQVGCLLAHRFSCVSTFCLEGTNARSTPPSRPTPTPQRVHVKLEFEPRSCESTPGFKSSGICYDILQTYFVASDAQRDRRFGISHRLAETRTPEHWVLKQANLTPLEGSTGTSSLNSTCCTSCSSQNTVRVGALRRAASMDAPAQLRV